MKVALAGGTGGLGKYIVDAFVNAGRQEQLVIFSRSSKDAKDPRTGVAVQGVDYDNVESLTKALDEQGIDAVVSCIVSFDWEDIQRKQDNLINAAVASQSVKRFIPSEWAMDCDLKKPGLVDPVMCVTSRNTRRKLESTDLEWTAVIPGLMMDYLIPKGPRHHSPWPIPVQPQEAKAIISGTGDEQVTMTMTDDIASAVIVFLDAPAGSWWTKTFVAGDTVTWNTVLNLAEDATGKKFAVQRVSEEELKARLEKAKKDGDALQQFVNEFELYGSVQGGLDLPNRSELLKGLKTTKVKDVMDLYRK